MTLGTEVNNSKSQLQQLQQTVATEDKALSQQINNVNAQVGKNTSAVQVVSKAQADLKGNVDAMWSMQVQATQDGKKVIAGIQATASGGVAQVLILADRFAVFNQSNGKESLPFIIENGQVIIDAAFLKRLFAASITSSGNPPTFSLTPNGHLTAKSADISGNVNATSGKFSNVVIDSTCDIKYLRAESIDGDITKTYVVNKNGTIAIPAQRFARKMILPSIVAGTYGYTTQTGGSNPSDKWYSSTSMAEITVNGSRIGAVTGPSISSFSTGQFLNTGSVLYTIPANTSITVGMNHKMTDYSTPSSFDYINPMAVIFVFKE